MDACCEEESKCSSVNKTFVIFLENKEQYMAYLNVRSKLDLHKLVICCLTVEAIDFCQSSKLGFVVPEDCYSDKEGDECWELSQKKVRELVDELNKYYHKKLGSIEGFRFDMGNYHFFMLNHFFEALHYRAFFLEKVIENFDADQVITFCEPLPKDFSRPFPVSLYVNCYHDLLVHSVYQERVVSISVQSAVHKFKVPSCVIARRLLGRILRKFSVLNSYLNYVRNDIPVNFLRVLFGKSKADILLLGSAGPWKYAFSDDRMSDRVDVVYDLEEVSIPDHFVKDWFYEWFEWENVFCGFNISALAYYEMARVHVFSEKILSSHEAVVKSVGKRRALIYSVCPYTLQQYWLSVAKHLGVPRICFQHGQMGVYPNGVWHDGSELMYLSHYFSYGDQVTTFKVKSLVGVNGNGRVISVGSPMLDNVEEAPSVGKTHILYASSKYLSYGAFVPRYTDLNVMKNQDLLINYFEQYLKENPEAKVIWKKNQEMDTSQSISYVDKVTVVQHEETFLNLLENAEIVVLDRPSTTSIEVCMTEKPLFALLANRNWYSLPEKLLKKRAVVVYTPEDLKDAVDKYLREGAYPADVKNREYVRAYGCYLDDGLSATRAVDELMKIIGS